MELLLRHWDQLQIVQQHVTIGEHSHEEWQWSLVRSAKAFGPNWKPSGGGNQSMPIGVVS